MNTRQPKGTPTGGRFASGAHDAATGEMVAPISERMDAIRDDPNRHGELSRLALANGASLTREAAPNASVLHLSDYKFALHVNSIADADGNRIVIDQGDFDRVSAAIAEANPVLVTRDGVLVHAEDPDGKGRAFFYDLNIDDAISSVRPRTSVPA